MMTLTVREGEPAYELAAAFETALQCAMMTAFPGEHERAVATWMTIIDLPEYGALLDAANRPSTADDTSGNAQ